MRDYTGIRSGRLTVIGFDHKTPTNHVYIKCKCDCGKKLCLSEWAEKYKINYETLLSRIRRGYPFEEVLNHKKYKLFLKRNSKTPCQ